MRIRKSEKLLGFESELRAAPSMPWDYAADIVAAAGLLCEINRSSINLCSSNHDQKEGFGAKEDIKNEKEPSRKRREKEEEATGKMKCKKMDGKGTASSYCCCCYSVLGIDGPEECCDREALADGVNGGAGEEEGYGKKMRPLKKRGRKPMKARSLKSLLSFKVC